MKSGKDAATTGVIAPDDPEHDHDLDALEHRAEHVAARLAELANAKRLLILCHLARKDAEAGAEGPGEATVGELQRAVGLGQSALSQHLARLRTAGMVATRRESQTIHYRIADEETRAIMRGLYDTFCGHQAPHDR